VWRTCDGRTDTHTLAGRCHTSQEHVRITLARLEDLGLLKVEPNEQVGDTRRAALRKITLAGAGLAAVPTISSIVVPTPGKALSGGIITEYPTPTSGSAPTGITTGPDGALWFTEQFANQIGRVTTSGAFTEYRIPFVGTDPFGITTGPDGALWFTEAGPSTSEIGRVTTSGAFRGFPAASSWQPR
jgi:streptogramin lyase